MIMQGLRIEGRHKNSASSIKPEMKDLKSCKTITNLLDLSSVLENVVNYIKICYLYLSNVLFILTFNLNELKKYLNTLHVNRYNL